MLAGIVARAHTRDNDESGKLITSLVTDDNSG